MAASENLDPSLSEIDNTPPEAGTKAPARPAEKEGAAGWPQSPFVWIAILLVAGIVMPFVPVSSLPAAIAGAALMTIVSSVSVVQFSAQATRKRLSFGAVLVTFVILAALWAILENYVRPIVGQRVMVYAAAQQVPPSSVLFPLILVRTLIDVLLLGAAVMAGRLLSRLVSEPNMMAPICGIIALIDIWGVLFGGIVSQLMDKAPQIASKAMASMPTIGAATATTRPEFVIAAPSIGVGDYLFLGFLFAALHTHHMNWRGAVRLITPLIAVALLAVVFGNLALPGLLFIGLGVALPNRQFFKFSRDEKFALIWAGVFVLVLTIGLYFAAPFIVKTAQNAENGGPARRSMPSRNAAPSAGATPGGGAGLPNRSSGSQSGKNETVSESP